MSESIPILRDMKSDDLDEVMAIENASFQSPWNRESFLNDIIRPDAITTVAVIQFHVKAYLVAWWLEDEVHIGNLAVHPDFRKQGLATALIERMLFQNPKFKVIWLEVRVSNREAQNLYQKAMHTLESLKADTSILIALTNYIMQRQH